MLNINQSLKDNGFVFGRMISFSKSHYRSENPDSVCYFNANIFTLEEGKVWYGDLDLTKDADALKQAAAQAGVTIYVLRELDGRFDNEKLSQEKLLSTAVWNTTQPTPTK